MQVLAKYPVLLITVQLFSHTKWLFFCFRHRLPQDQWWMKLRSLLRILAKHSELTYVADVPQVITGIDETEDDDKY